MKLLVGLGNPGSQYEANRHNVGFMAVDAIWRKHPFSPWTKKFKALVSEGEIDGRKVMLLKPQTFMNLSGESAGEAMRFFKLAPSDIICFHDELDLPAGKLRTKTGGGHGGHNGLKSMDAHCGREYLRVRIGIGHPGVKEMVHNHVLGDFAKADHGWLDALLDDIALHAALLFDADQSRFMNKLSPPAPKGEATGEGTPKAGAKGGQKGASGQSHVRQAREHKPVLPASGPMAEMLKKLLGKD